MSINYLTRVQAAERYPISQHTLAKLASEGRGPRFYKPTDKCLYRSCLRRSLPLSRIQSSRLDHWGEARPSHPLRVRAGAA
ncbi:MAG: Helix-turn-helix protein [Devosia sp.]|nr:Helix-turn-helix protein [Devosia sp.]